MATLAGTTIANTFDSLLHVEDNTAGLVATSTDSRVIQDGVGANSALALATDSVRITSTNKLYFNDVGGEYISGDGTNLTITSGNDIILDAGSTGSVYASGAAGTGNTAFGDDSGIALTGNYNTFYGSQAGLSLTSGGNNVAMGRNALATHVDGSYNIAIGVGAMGDTDAGTTVDGSLGNIMIGEGAGGAAWSNSAVSNYNVGIGYQTMRGVLNGALDNVAVGKDSLKDLTTGDDNVAIGTGAAENLTTGKENVVIGSGAYATANTSENYGVAVGFNAANLLDGIDNVTAIGHSALSTMVAVDGNTAVGFEAGKVTTGANNTYLGFKSGKGASGAEASNVGVGSRALESVTTGSGNVVMGYQAGDALVGGDDNIIIGNGAGTATTAGTNMVIIGKGAGTAVITAAAAGTVAVGYEAAYGLTSGAKNTHLGYRAGKDVTTAFNNVWIGYQAGEHHLTGSRNIAIGALAMGDTDAGSNSRDSSDNIFIGNQAGGGTWVNNVSSANVGIGHGVMDAAMDASENNTAVGHNAMTALTQGDQNVAIGRNAGAAITTGGDNVLVGDSAGSLIVAGASNVLVGRNCGDTIEEGSGNTGLGHNVDFNSTNPDGRIAIGQSFTATDDNSVHLGNDHGFVKNSFSSNNTWTQVSDERLKKNINNDSLGLEFINELRPVTFNWKPLNEVDTEFINGCPNHNGEKDTETLIHGLIAQEVKSAMDKVSNTTFNGWEDSVDGQSISREMFITPLIKAIQELSAKVKALEDA